MLTDEILRSPCTIADYVAHFPLMNSTTGDTAYAGGIAGLMRMIGHRMPYSTRRSLPRQFVKYRSQVLPQLLFDDTSEYLRSDICTPTSYDLGFCTCPS
jgi:hypothetical protein